MPPFPRHGGGTLQHGVNRIEQRAVPMVFQDAPAAFNRVVLAMVRGVIGETHGHPILLHNIDDSPHKLGAAALILRTVIEIDHQGGQSRKSLANRLPPLGEPIHQAVAGHFRGHPLDKQFLQRGEEDAHRGDRRHRLKIVVSGCDVGPRLPTAREGADLDGGFGVHRDPQDAIRRIRGVIDLPDVVEDGIGFWDFFVADFSPPPSGSTLRRSVWS